jgi:hypothetical protein
MKKLLFALMLSVAAINSAAAHPEVYQCFPTKSDGTQTEVMLDHANDSKGLHLYMEIAHKLNNMTVNRQEQYAKQFKVTKKILCEGECVSWKWSGVLVRNPSVTMIGTLDGVETHTSYGEEQFTNGKLSSVSNWSCKNESGCDICDK